MVCSTLLIFQDLKMDFQDLKMDFQNLKMDFQDLKMDFHDLKMDAEHLDIASEYQTSNLKVQGYPNSKGFFMKKVKKLVPLIIWNYRVPRVHLQLPRVYFHVPRVHL